MARSRQRDPIDPTERHPFGRRRFLQGAAATTAAAFPILRAGSARAGGGCDLYDTPPSFMGVVPDPESVLGFPIGVDEEVSAADSNTYLQAVAASSDRVREALVGHSVDGRPIRYAVVGHPDNITVGGLEAIRQANLEIRDPETRQGRADELARTTPAFAWMTGNVHGSEESGADAALQLLYELADRDDCVVDRILDELVIFVIPVQNPDGRVLDQRRNAYGFDLNRDFFARAQVETDDRVELMRTYPPVLLLDHHEFGYYRSFFPPNADPVHHEVPEQVMRQIDDLYGPAMARLFHRNGWPFFNGGIYDFLAPQFNDTGTSLGFGGVGMTLEVYNGSPMDRRFARQLGIQWACLWQLARNRRRVLRAWHDASVTAVEQGKAGKLEPNKRYFRPDLKVRTPVPTEPLRHYFVLDTPRTHDEVSILIRRLQRMDIDVYRLDEDTPLPDFHELGVPFTGNSAPAAEKGARTPRREEGRRVAKSLHVEDKPVKGSDGREVSISLYAQDGAIGIGVLTDRGEMLFEPLRRFRTHRTRDKSGGYRWYNDYRLPQRLGGCIVTVRLHANDEDRAKRLNRTENVRPIPPSDPDFARLYARRNDAESINRNLEDTLFLGRAHSVGRLRQQVDLIGYALLVNGLTLFRHERRGRLPAAA